MILLVKIKFIKGGEQYQINSMYQLHKMPVIRRYTVIARNNVIVRNEAIYQFMSTDCFVPRNDELI